MSPGSKVLIVLVVASLGVWGCAQGPTNGSASAERVRALETKISKLEDDFRAAVTARDQLRKRVASLEDERTGLNQQIEQLQLAVKDRDELRKQLTVRTTERDSVQTQFEQLRKGIKSLLGQVEAASTSTTQPVTSAVAVQTAGKS
jgi:chromosome segregation ATPase